MIKTAKLTEKQILKNKIEIKKSPCIYFLIKGYRIVYVGQSVSTGLDRIKEHISFKSFNAYSIQNCNERELDDLETYYILQFRPRYNKILPRQANSLSIINQQWLEENKVAFDDVVNGLKQADL